MCWGTNTQSRSVLHVYSVNVKRQQVKLEAEIFTDVGQQINDVIFQDSTMVLSQTNEKLRIFSSLSWTEQFSFDHSMPELTTTNTGELINIYMEKDTPYDGCLYEAMQRPFALPRKATRGGLIKVCLSHDGRFVATVSACTPACIWLWDL